MTGGAFKERARASAIDRAEEDIARLGDDLDNFQATHADANVISRAEAELADATRARDALQALGDGDGETQLLNARAIDLYQRGLRHLADEAGGGATEGGRNIAAVRNTFMQNLRSVSPELSDAIGQARGFHALREARELGQSIFRPGKEAEVDALLRRTMTTDEQDSFMVGALDTIEARLGANDLSFVRSLQRNQNWRALVMRSARSKNAGQRLMDLIDDKVSELDSANFQRGGSQTAPIGQDIRRLTTDESELGFVQDVLDSGGSVQGPAMRLFARGVERFTKPGIRNPQVQTELARMLTQPGTQQNAATLATRLSMAPKASIFTPEAQSLQTGAGQVGSSVAQLGAATDPAVAEMTGVPGVARGVDALAHGRPGEGAQELAFAGMGLIPFVRGGRLALGAATGLGATAAGAGVAQAQEDQGQERDTMRREMASIQDQIAQIESERSVLAAASRLRTPEAISEAQRVLQGRSLYNHDVDGDWGPIMREAAERFEAQNVARLQPLQARLGELQQQESLQELTVSPEEEARRQALLGFGMAGGGLLGKFGLPIPRRIPGIGRLSGALGRSGTVRGVERKLGEQTAGANAVQFPSTPIVRRTAVHDAEAAARAARVNEFWTLGGARERVPFRVGAGARPEIRQRAVEAPRLFQPPRFSGEDYGYMGLGALDVGGALSALPAATQELAEAERAARAHPESRANIIRVQHARDAVFRLELAARIGGGYIGGRVVGGYTSGYERLPRPSFSAAQAEQGRIARYVASSPAPRLRRQPK